MELTIEQALQQGITAHKEGKLQDAERLYRAILKSQPAHPTANHNLGTIALSSDKAESALPFFKSAVEANPSVGQFWLSYIQALINAKKLDDAQQALEQAKKYGTDEERLNPLEAQLSPTTRKSPTTNKKPPQELLTNLLKLYQSREYGEAEKLAVKITQDFPEHEFAWKVLGAVLGRCRHLQVHAPAQDAALAARARDPSRPHGVLGHGAHPERRPRNRL